MARINLETEARFIDELRELETPFSSRAEAADAFETNGAEHLSVDELEKVKLEKILQVLRHPVLDHLIDKGKITFAMIKPHANEGMGLSEDDDQATTELIQEIGEERVKFSLPFMFTHHAVERFYGPIRKAMRKKQIEKPTEDEKTVWDQIMNYFPSGPVTFLLVYVEEGNAVQWLMDITGKTLPEENDPDSIRKRHMLNSDGSYALSLPNNLIHRSSSIDEVKREVDVLANILEESLENQADKSLTLSSPPA